jgi:hypothetical protein
VVSLLTPGSLPDDVQAKMLVLHLPERLRGRTPVAWPNAAATAVLPDGG